MMESFGLLIKIITTTFYGSLEVMHVFLEKKCKIIVFGHMGTKVNFYQETDLFNVYSWTQYTFSIIRSEVYLKTMQVCLYYKTLRRPETVIYNKSLRLPSKHGEVSVMFLPYFSMFSRCRYWQ